jgi:CRP/FNR family cyclic AMP-dependent transcriptional regulator
MTPERHTFSISAFLESVGVDRTVVEYRRGDIIFRQGHACEHIWHIESGTVKLSVVSAVGKEAVMAMLGPGDFLGRRVWPACRHTSAPRRRSRRAHS